MPWNKPIECLFSQRERPAKTEAPRYTIRDLDRASSQDRWKWLLTNSTVLRIGGQLLWHLSSMSCFTFGLRALKHPNRVAGCAGSWRLRRAKLHLQCGWLFHEQREPPYQIQTRKFTILELPSHGDCGLAEEDYKSNSTLTLSVKSM